MERALKGHSKAREGGEAGARPQSEAAAKAPSKPLLSRSRTVPNKKERPAQKGRVHRAKSRA